MKNEIKWNNKYIFKCDKRPRTEIYRMGRLYSCTCKCVLTALRIKSLSFTEAANTGNPHSRLLEAVSNTVVVVMPTKQSLLLATVSQWSDQTAEHSHFTLTDLSHAVFTPVAAPKHSEPWTLVPGKHMQSQSCTQPAKQLRLWTGGRGKKTDLKEHDRINMFGSLLYVWHHAETKPNQNITAWILVWKRKTLAT